MATPIQNPNEPLAIDPPTYEYSWDFDYGMGPWTTWLAPSVVNEVGGQYERFTRLNAPGALDPNHLDGIGALRLVAHLSIPTTGSPGVMNLTNAEFQITIRGTDFHANGAKLVVWLCRYVPEEQVFKNYYVGLTVTNWANTGNDIAAQLTDEWQTITVSLSNNPDDWTYAGTNNAQQGDWADRYQPVSLDETLAYTDATLHLVLVSDEPDQAPTGFLDIANITVRTQTPAAGLTGEQPEIFYGLEDQATVGVLAGDPSVDDENATFSLVSGSVTNGTVTIDPDTGAFSFTPNANFFGPTDFVGHAGFRYRVTDGTTTVEHRAFLFIGPVNDAPTASTAVETVDIAFGAPFEFSLFKGLDVDIDERLTYHLVPDGATNGTVTLNTENGRYVFTPTAGFSGTASFSYYVSDGQIDSAPKTVTLNVRTEADPPVRLTYDQAVDFLIAGDPQSFVYHAILLAQAGNANAAYHYGTFLGNGRFVPRDAALSAYYLGLAVGQVADANLQLADRYVTGDGVDMDFAAARALLEALPDNATALYRLGTLENLGLGAPRDDVRAVELYLLAANLGNADAMYTVGRRYLMAEGVAYSAADAYFWLAVGLRLNGGPAITQFDNLLLFNMNQAAQDLTVEERAALDAAAAVWVPGQEPGVNNAPEPVIVAGEGGGPQIGLSSHPFSGIVPEATDSDGDRLTYRLVAGSAQNGTVTIDADTGAFVFTPTGGYVGPASFQYVVSDGHSESAPTTVALDFHPATGTTNDTASTAEATTVTVGAESGLLANDSVSDAGVSIAVTAVAGQPAGVGQPVSGSYGVITINADGSYSYTPAESTRALIQGQTVVETFTYTITDGQSVSATGTLTITISGVAGTVVVTSGLYIGTAFDDVITGGTAKDILLGQDGNDILVGGSGAANELYGGTGNDTYVVSVLGDTIIENADAGTDTVQTALAAYTLRTHLENLTFTGTGNFAGTGNTSDNVLTGGAGADTLTGLAGADILDGGAGIDTLIGGTGDDLYRVDAAGDVVTELAAQGLDTVSSSVNAWTLGANIENLSFAGTGNFTGTGNGLANAITGGTGHDTLDGAAGDDVLTGGLGNDTYVVDSAGDVVVESADAGSDTIRTVLNVYALGDHIEGLTFTGTGAFQGTGNALDNAITGGAGDDTLDGGLGADTLTGGLGDDTYTVDDASDVVVEEAAGGFDTVVATSNSYVLADNIEDLTFTGTGDFAGTGNASDNAITGGDGHDTLDGAAGDDVLTGGLGDDVYVVDSLDDTVVEAAGEGSDTIRTTLNAYGLGDHVEGLAFIGTGDFAGTGNALDNAITGGAGHDTLDGGLGADALTGGSGDDLYLVDNAGDVVTEADGEGADTVRTTLNTYTLTAHVEGLEFTGTGDFEGTGNALDNAITGGAGHDTLDGGLGADTLTGGSGDDLYLVDNAGDVVTEAGGEGADTVRTTLNTYGLTDHVERLEFTGTGDFAGTGNDLDNTLVGGAGDDTLDGGLGADTLTGGLGDDTYVDDGSDTIVENAGEGTDTVRTSLNVYTLGHDLENLTFDGTGAAFGDFDGTGNALDNVITGGAGDDILDGAAGADTLVGGDGADLYVVDDAGDLVVEAADEGFDAVETTLNTYTLADNVEGLAFLGEGAFSGTGNAGDNEIHGGDDDDTLTGLGGADLLVGGAGADTLIGGTDDDIYLVEDGGDVVVEAIGQGYDTVLTTLNSYTLSGNVEALHFLGTGDFTGTGNGRDNLIVGGAGHDTLRGGRGDDYLAGGAGDDLMIGGLGADRFAVDDAGDVVTELSDEGIDTVETTLAAYTLTAHVEDLEFVGTGDFAGTGNALANAITGGDGDDTLDGAAGDDVLSGGLGDDTYVVDSLGDAVIEAEGEGSDTIRTTLNTYGLGDHVEGLAFIGTGDFAGTGNALDNAITGGAGNDTLDGGLGADTLAGGLGDDVYLIDDLTDVVVETDGEGSDTVRTALNALTLADHVEVLEFTGTGDFAGTGNDLANSLVGGGGNDTLDGGLGADTLTGGLGDDVYVVDDLADVVVEVEGEGSDTVRTSLNALTLAARVERLEFTGTGDFAGTGNALANAIIGGTGNDTLDGAAGDDVLTGGLGDDVYVVDSLDDTVIEAEGEGADTIRTALNTYALTAHVEGLTFTGTGDFAGTGNALDNAITGGAGHDTLDGGLGADALTGGLGDDLYLVDNAGDAVIEAEGAGTDTVRTTLGTYALTAHVEVLTFTGTGDFAATGNALDNVITGGAGNDTLDGAGGDDLLDALAGADTLRGGTGNDRFVVRDAGDVVVELADEGTDRVLSHLNAYTLTDNVETLEFVGTGSFVGTGNALTNTLIGGSGADTLDGGSGDDLMIGGAGNDLYLVAQAGDLVEELAGGGTDSVRTTLAAYTLAANVENLTYTGSGSFSGRGNALANTITGGSGNDSLSGGAGNDQLVGGAGIDTVDYSLAGAGVTVRLNTAQTTVDGDGGTDTLSGFENATGSAFDDTLIGDSGANVLTGGAGRDTLLGLGGNDILIGGAGLANQMQGGTGDDRYVVSAADSIVELSGEGTDTVETGLAAYTLGNHLENLVSTSGLAFVGNGNALNNVITSGAGNDTLSGGAGADTLDAGGGDDLVRGGAGVDVMTGGTGVDTVDYSLAAARVVARLDQGRATDDGDGGTDTFSGFENLTGSAFDDTLIGSSGSNTLTGGTGRDTLLGLGGDDILIGGAGLANQMQGGAGNDTYVVSANDSLIELAGEGTDLVLAALASFTLGTNIENLTYTGSSNFTGTGNGSDNVITGGIGADTLSGAAGRDTLLGGAGHDVLIGGTGDDFMFGGTGNDRYSVDSAGDLVTELVGEGTDTIETTLAAYILGANLENLTFLGSGGFIGTGNALDNVITGGGGNDTFIAGAGSDTFIGGAGIDTIDYSAVGSGVTVKLSALTASNDGEGGTDVLNSIENVIGTAFNDMLFGDGYANVLTGGAGWDVLLGLGGDDVLIGGDGLANTLQGGTGNDLYVVSALGDSVVETAGEGTDTVQTSLASYSLSANVEHLTFTGSGSFTGRGNALNNTITGGSGSDTVVVSGLRAQYLIETVTGGYRVTDLDAVADGNDGIDLLAGIEFLRFKDGTTLDLSTVGASSAPLVSQKGSPGAAGDAFIGGPGPGDTASPGHDLDLTPGTAAFDFPLSGQGGAPTPDGPVDPGLLIGTHPDWSL